MGFNTEEIYQSESSWLKAADLKKQKHRVVISDVQLQEVTNDGRKQRRLELHFQGKDKTLLLNKTNSDTITYIHGQDTDGWMGQEVVLYPTMVDFGGKSVEAIRIEMPLQEAPMHDAGVEATKPAEVDFEDDIPF